MIEEVTLQDDTTIRFAEHELLLSFNNDSGKEKFEDWWFTEGESLFNNYCKEYRGAYE